METLTHWHEYELRHQIERLYAVLGDCEIDLRDRQRDLDGAIGALRQAEAHRDAVAENLADLIAQLGMVA